jgi:hypothetical protein
MGAGLSAGVSRWRVMDRLARREYVLDWLVRPRPTSTGRRYLTHPADKCLLFALKEMHGIIAGGFVRDLCLHDRGLKGEFNDLDLWFSNVDEWKSFQFFLASCECKKRIVSCGEYEEGMPGSFYLARWQTPTAIPIDVMCLNPQDEARYNTSNTESTCGLEGTAWDRYLEDNFDYSVNLALIHPTHGLAISPSFADWLEMSELGEGRLCVRSNAAYLKISYLRRRRFEATFCKNATLTFGFDTHTPWLCRGEEVPF